MMIRSFLSPDVCPKLEGKGLGWDFLGCSLCAGVILSRLRNSAQSVKNNFSFGIIYWWVLDNLSGVKGTRQGWGKRWLCVQGQGFVCAGTVRFCPLCKDREFVCPLCRNRRIFDWGEQHFPWKTSHRSLWILSQSEYCVTVLWGWMEQPFPWKTAH